MKEQGRKVKSYINNQDAGRAWWEKDGLGFGFREFAVVVFARAFRFFSTAIWSLGTIPVMQLLYNRSLSLFFFFVVVVLMQWFSNSFGVIFFSSTSFDLLIYINFSTSGLQHIQKRCFEEVMSAKMLLNISIKKKPKKTIQCKEKQYYAKNKVERWPWCPWDRYHMNEFCIVVRQSSIPDLFSIQFNFICIVSITMQIFSRWFTETQSMNTEQVSLTKVIILNPNQRKMASKKKLPQQEKTYRQKSKWITSTQWFSVFLKLGRHAPLGRMQQCSPTTLLA